MIIFVMILLPSYSNGKSSSSDFSNTVLKLLRQNNKKYLTFTTMDNDTSEVIQGFQNLVRKAKQMSGLRSRVLPIKQLNERHHFHQDTLVLVTSATSKYWKKYREIIASSKVMSCVVVCIGKLQNQAFKELETSLRTESENAFFYWIGTNDENSNTSDWKQIISVKNSQTTLSTSMKFDSFGGVKQETNLQGLHINCSTLSWSPWFKLTNCKGSSNTDCSGVGYLADAMNFLSVRFNFTWSCDAQPNRHWGGQQPISGPKNASGSWGGVVGNVVNGTYPLCISVWHHMDWRHEMLDYAFMGTGRKFIIAYLPSSSSYDIWLFIKPFRHDTWLCIVVV